VDPEDSHTKTIFDNSSQYSRNNTVPYTESKVEIDNNEQKQIRHEPASTHIEKKELNKKR